jgi:hypothetical protein
MEVAEPVDTITPHIGSGAAVHGSLALTDCFGEDDDYELPISRNCAARGSVPDGR